jgi:hypothetical protein
VLHRTTDADGDGDYEIGGVRLSVGPPWFWGDAHPLTGLVGTIVTVTGTMDEGPGPNANAKAKASDEPELDVYTVNGKTIREPGKPPWAGGPKVVGERHPGWAGWSKHHGPGGKVPEASPED